MDAGVALKAPTCVVVNNNSFLAEKTLEDPAPLGYFVADWTNFGEYNNRAEDDPVKKNICRGFSLNSENGEDSLGEEMCSRSAFTVFDKKLGRSLHKYCEWDPEASDTKERCQVMKKTC